MIIFENKSWQTRNDKPNENWLEEYPDIEQPLYVVDDNSKLAQKIMRTPQFNFITDEEGQLIDISEIGESVGYIISQKKVELSEECEKAIISGVDVGEAHYSLTIEDQANILAWMAVAQTGKSVPYHQDGQPCRIYTAEEFMKVANAAVAYKTHHTTYCNLLMRQVESMTETDAVRAVQYGITELEGEFAEQYQTIMASLGGDTSETNS